MSDSPTVISIEEPHEVVPVWRKLTEDTSSDRLCVTRFSRSTATSIPPLWPKELSALQHSILHSPIEALQATRYLLSRDTYLLPAIASDIIDQVFLITKKEPLNKAPLYLQAVFFPTANPQSIEANYSDELHQGRCHATLSSGTMEDVPPANSKLFIEIDCSYFSANARPSPANAKIEVTDAGLQSIQENPYHNIHLLFGGSLSTEKSNGQSYLVFNNYSTRPHSLMRCETDEISCAIDQCLSFLEKRKSEICGISIAHSKRSGHTPSDQADKIHNHLLKGIQQRVGATHLTLEEFIGQ